MQVPESVVKGLGVTVLKNNSWTMKRTVQDCILREMDKRGLKNGTVKVESPSRDTSYLFEFGTKTKPAEMRSFRVEYDNGLVVTTDMGETFEKEWGGEVTPEEKERIEPFMEALAECASKLGSKAGPAAPPAKKEEDDGGLEEAFGKMSVGKGRTRRNKKSRATRRRKTNLHNRRR